MSFDEIMNSVNKMNLIEWAKTIPPEHRIIVLILAWCIYECDKRKVYDSLLGRLDTNYSAKDDYEKSCRDLGVDPEVLSAPLLAIVIKFAKVLEAKERS
jgi:hypothetical protein